MPNPKVSVIITVYKAEKYIARCMHSLCDQSFRDFEVVLADDCTPDGSIEVAQKALADGGFCGDVKHVSNQRNSGVGLTRQIGLDAASGDWIIFIDSDDWVEPDYLKCLYDTLLATNADIAICDFNCCYPHETIRTYCSPKSLKPNDIIFELCNGTLFGSCWNKMVRRELIERANAHFIPGVNVCEDLLFNLQLYLTNPITVLVPEALYNYDKYTNTNSIQRTLLADHLKHDMRLLSEAGLILDQEENADGLNRFTTSVLFHIFEISDFTNSQFRNRFKKYSRGIMRNKSFSLKKRISLYLACNGFYRPMRAIYSIQQRT